MWVECQGIGKLRVRNNHLAPLKSAGLNTNHGKKMDATLLQKVEELTLYVLQLKKENEEQQQEIEGLVKESCKN